MVTDFNRRNPDGTLTDRERAADELYEALSVIVRHPFDRPAPNQDMEAVSSVVLRLVDDHDRRLTSAALHDVAELVRLTIKLTKGGRRE